ncbi:hypothetical protein DFO77_102249 [Marinilabilia salmonicolor]|uniref:Uncharacterized protein n=1 Tax=Marinilabilia salmonicolor TaxID=989 RepID=A0A368VHF9_9BACT|nr:hypothetical protein DFO77_102249 [Marinilabilia salmonicolor]
MNKSSFYSSPSNFNMYMYIKCMDYTGGHFIF